MVSTRESRHWFVGLTIRLAVIAAVGSVSALGWSAAVSAAPFSTLVDNSLVRVEGDGKSAVRITGKPGLLGKPIVLEQVKQDQSAKVMKKFTPSASKPSVTVRGLSRSGNYRISSPALDRPVMFRLAVASANSTAKGIDTTSSPPSGNVLLEPVTAKAANADVNVNTYYFPAVGQTVRFTEAVRVDKVAVGFAPMVTYSLTREGVRLMQSPEGIDWNDPSIHRIYVFNDDPAYSFPATVKLTVYSGVPGLLVEQFTKEALTEVASFSTRAKIGQNGYLSIDTGGLDLPAGEYLFEFAFEDLDDAIFTIFLKGSNHGGPKNRKDTYPAGQLFRLESYTTGDVTTETFVRHDTKRMPPSSIGNDRFDPADLRLIIYGELA